MLPPETIIAVFHDPGWIRHVANRLKGGSPRAPAAANGPRCLKPASGRMGLFYDRSRKGG